MCSMGSFVGQIVDGEKTLKDWLNTKQGPRLHISGIVQELCESRGGRPGLSVITSLLVSVDVKIY